MFAPAKVVVYSMSDKTARFDENILKTFQCVDMNNLCVWMLYDSHAVYTVDILLGRLPVLFSPLLE